MPIKNRHNYRDLGAITVPGTSKEIDVEEFTKGILYLDSTAGAVVTVEVSPDGTDWYPLNDMDGDPLVITTALTEEAHMLDVVGKRMRISAITQDVAGAILEGLREIA